MKLRRWTPLLFLRPAPYVDVDEFWSGFDLDAWADETYEWNPDPWNGVRDFVQPPRETVDGGRGDCEDFALVALSWARAQDRDGLGLGFCWAWPYPWPTHAIAFDEERVYSSGERFEGAVDEWLDQSDYDYVLTRRVR